MPPAPPPAPDRSEPRRARAVPVLAVVSSVLAVALIAVSLAWWSSRDGASADADQDAESTVTTVAPDDDASPRSDAGDDGEQAGDGDGWRPAASPRGTQGDVPADDGGDAGAGGPLQDLLDGLLGGAGDAVPELSPECLDGSLWDMLGDLGGADLDGSLTDQIRQIAATVEEQRGLRFTEEIEPRLVEAAAFDQEVADAFTEEYTAAEADLDARVLSTLGAIPEDRDLRESQIDLLSGQVAGYYDPETGDIVVRDDGDGELDAAERLTLAHELDHALTDQALGLPDTELEGDSDAVLAGLALVEGDATLLMQQWALGNLGIADQLGQLLDPDAAAAQAELETVPHYLRQELMFPYLSGLGYACRLHADGGWPAVDAAYDGTELPVTTAEVLFADRAGVPPVDPTEPGTLAGPWTEARRDTLGAAQLWWLFSAPGGDEGAALTDARDLAAHWAGGEVVLSTDGDRSALGVSLVDRGDGFALCDAVDTWSDRVSIDGVRTADGATVVDEAPDRVTALTCDGRQVRLGIGPDRATALALID